MAKEDRMKALELALTQIEKDFGKEAIMKMGDKALKVQVKRSPRGPFRSTSPSAWGEFPAGAWSKFTVRNHPARRP